MTLLRPFFDQQYEPEPPPYNWRERGTLPRDFVTDFSARLYHELGVSGEDFYRRSRDFLYLPPLRATLANSEYPAAARRLYRQVSPPITFGAMERWADWVGSFCGGHGGAIDALVAGVLRRQGIVDLRMVEGRFLLSDSYGLHESTANAAVVAATRELPETRLAIQRALTGLALAANDSVAAKDAIQDAHHAVEMAARHVLGSRDILSGIAKSTDFKARFPDPLPTVIAKLSGYCSEVARHRHDGHAVSFESARFVVHTCASLVSLLLSSATATAVLESKP